MERRYNLRPRKWQNLYLHNVVDRQKHIESQRLLGYFLSNPSLDKDRLKNERQNTHKSKCKMKKMAYLYLAIAILAEVTATSALKASNEFTKVFPVLIIIIGYGLAFYFMTLVLRTLPIGTTYAIWSSMGIVLVTIVGAILYKQVPDTPAIIGMGLIIIGVAIINIFSKTITN